MLFSIWEIVILGLTIGVSGGLFYASFELAIRLLCVIFDAARGR